MRVGDAGEGYALLRHDGADDGSSRSIGGLIMTSEPETESETEAEKAWNSVTRLERRQDEAQVCVSESGALHRYMVALRELRSGFVLDKRGYFASSGDVVEAMRRVHGFHYDTSRGLSQEQRTKALASKNPIVSGAVHTMPSALISFISSISDWSSLLAWAGAIVLFVIFGAGDIELHEGSGPSDDPDKRSDYWTITSKFGFLGGITMMSLVFVCSLTKFLSDRLAREQLPPLQPLLRARASVRVDGRMQELTAPQLVRGDVVRLEAGQVVPADCVVIALDDDVESLTVRGDLAMMSKHRDVDESIHVAFAGSRVRRLFACRNGAALRHMIRIFIIAGYAVGMGVVAFESTGLSHLIYATFGAAALATLGVIWGAASVLRGNALFQAALLTLRNDSEMATRMITARAGFTPVGASIGRAG